MRTIFTILSFMAVSLFGSAQQNASKDTNGKMKMWIVNGDTTISYVLDDFVFEKTDYEYHRMKRYVRNMYPYVLHCKERLNYYDSVLTTITKSNKRRKFMKKANNELKEDFKFVVKDMSQNEGKVLCKLLHKETGLTAYDIISRYRGTANALLWQGLSKTGGADLKLEYNPDNSSFDRYLARVMKEIDHGLIDVASEPDTMTKKEYKDLQQERKERTKRLRKRRKERKRKERKAKRKGDKEDVAFSGN